MFCIEVEQHAEHQKSRITAIWLKAVITMLICESRGERQLKFRCIIS